MAQVSLDVNGRKYTVACDDGEEERLYELSEYVDRHVKDLAQSVGQVGDTRLMLLAGLMISDELSEALARHDALQVEVELLRENQKSFLNQAEDVGDAIADVLERASKRVEEIATSLEDA